MSIRYPANDLSRKRSAEFGFPIYPTIAEALRRGGKELAVDAVLIIGEHGDTRRTSIGQKKYPRYEFFKQVTDVFRKDGRTTPVFNDKHLSWKWEWAKEMVETSRELRFPFLAGSSLPVTWRMPSIDMPYGAEVEEMMCVAFGGVDSYDFHALETIQCMAERRRGGETGVAAVQGLARRRGLEGHGCRQLGRRRLGPTAVRGVPLPQPDRWRSPRRSATAIRPRRRSASGCDPRCVPLRVCRRAEGHDALLNGLVGDFTFAARLKGEPEPLSTLFYLPPNPNVVYSAALMSKAEETFLTGKTPYPIERTLLTTGLVEAGVRSLGAGQKRIETPHLAIRYQAPRASTFAQS